MLAGPGLRTLVRIRERSQLELLDLALVVVRHRPGPIALAAAAGVAPFAALNAVLLDEAMPPLLVPAVLMLEAPWATAPLTVLLGGLMFGSRPSAGQVAGTLARSLAPMLLVQGALRALLVATVVGAWIVPAWLGFAGEVILLERGPWRKVLPRSAALSRRGGGSFGAWMAQVAFGAAFAACFWMASGTLFAGLTAELTWERPAWADLLGWRFQLGAWIAIAFAAVARFLTYVDRRSRLEGWELELRLRAVGAALEGEARWASR